MAFADFERFGDFGQAASQTLQFQGGALIERKLSQSLADGRLEFLVHGQLIWLYRPAIEQAGTLVPAPIQARLPPHSAGPAAEVDARVGDRS